VVVHLDTIYVEFQGEGHRPKFVVTEVKVLLMAGVTLNESFLMFSGGHMKHCMF